MIVTLWVLSIILFIAVMYVLMFDPQIKLVKDGVTCPDCKHEMDDHGRTMCFGRDCWCYRGKGYVASKNLNWTNLRIRETLSRRY